MSDTSTFGSDQDKLLPGPPKEPKIMAQYLKIETIGSIGSIISAILEVQVDPTVPYSKRTLGDVTVDVAVHDVLRRDVERGGAQPTWRPLPVQ